MSRPSPAPSAEIGGPAAGGDRLEYNLVSDPANLAPVRRDVEAFCVEHGLPREAADAVGLVLNEALANVYRHAYAGQQDGPVRLTVEDEAAAVRFSIRDWGSGVDPARLPPKQRDPLTPGGLGLICLRRLMDTAEFIAQPDGMLLTMTKRKQSV